jgi:hypothetical protein
MMPPDAVQPMPVPPMNPMSVPPMNPMSAPADVMDMCRMPSAPAPRSGFGIRQQRSSKDGCCNQQS